MLCDQHVVKMCTEAAQLAYTAMRLRYAELIAAGKCREEDSVKFFSTAPLVTSKAGDSRGFKSTHANHPLAVWTRESHANLLVVVKMCEDICKEYTYRYNKEHGTYKHAVWLRAHVAKPPFPRGDGDVAAKGMTTPPLCLPEEYHCEGRDLVASYRHYYIKEKASFARYWYRQPPAYIRGHLAREQMDKAFSGEIRKSKKATARKALVVKK
jgi:hypothetical protein